MRYLIGSVLASCGALFVADKPAVVGGPIGQGVVISRIVGRHDVMIVRAGANGATYSLQTKGGETLVPAATLGDLAVKKAELSGRVEAMQAEADWAGVDTDVVVP